MGCDVHIYAEIKIDDRWEHAGAIDVGRNYDLFGCMVDGHMRAREIDGVAQARNLPKDINPYSKLLLDRYSAHTHSWLTHSECMKVNKLYKAQNVSGESKPFVLENDWDYPCDVNDDNFRIVFGFGFGFDS